MLLREQTASNRRFHRQLDRIRTKIETLPEERRPYFRSLADQAEEHHHSMESDCARIQEFVDSLARTRRR
jgi:hypothetical protein